MGRWRHGVAHRDGGAGRRGEHGSRGRPRRDGERGATLVEAAIVTPLFFLMIFGILEFGAGYGDRLGVNNSVTAGARTASAAADDGFADYLILKEVEKNISAAPTNAVNRVVIFNAGSTSGEPTKDCKKGTASVSDECNVYTPDDFDEDPDHFGCKDEYELDKFWCPATDRTTAQSVANGGPPDYIGVWMSFDHKFFTGLFGSDITITDQQVIRIEPRRL